MVGAATTASWTITLDSPHTLGALTFANSASNTVGYTLAAGTSGSLTLDNSTSAAQIIVTGGSHGIASSVAITLNSNLVVTPSGRTTLEIDSQRHQRKPRKQRQDAACQRRRHADPRRQQQLLRRHDRIQRNADIDQQRGARRRIELDRRRRLGVRTRAGGYPLPSPLHDPALNACPRSRPCRNRGHWRLLADWIVDARDLSQAASHVKTEKHACSKPAPAKTLGKRELYANMAAGTGLSIRVAGVMKSASEPSHSKSGTCENVLTPRALAELGRSNTAKFSCRETFAERMQFKTAVVKKTRTDFRVIWGRFGRMIGDGQPRRGLGAMRALRIQW